jgi:hypothetical protein
MTSILDELIYRARLQIIQRQDGALTFHFHELIFKTPHFPLVYKSLEIFWLSRGGFITPCFAVIKKKQRRHLKHACQPNTKYHGLFYCMVVTLLILGSANFPSVVS